MERSYRIPESEQLERWIRTALEEAIYDVLKGPVPASEALGVSRQAIHGLLDSGAVRSRVTALKIQEKTRENGREVPATELMELVPWRGPERHGGGNGNGRAKATKRGKGASSRSRSSDAEKVIALPAPAEASYRRTGTDG